MSLWEVFNKLTLVQNVQFGHFEWFLSFIYYTFLRRKLYVQTIKGFEGRSWFNPKELAKLLSFTTSAYSKIERGERTLTAEVLIDLSNFYNVSTDYLLGITDYPNKIHIK